MGLFKDFKEDFSQAVNEMMPGNETSAKDSKPEELVVNTLGEDVDVKKELSKLDGLLEQVKKDEEPAVKSTLETEIPNVMYAKEEEPAVFSINAHSKARILVAEDEPVNQQVIGKLLGMAGFSYDIAENGQKAVELFKQKIYDAALFDVQMPVMDGIAATQEIREIEQKEKRKRLPIIAVTARAMFGDKERILENKLDDYIAKPYNLNDVVETLNKYIDD